MTQGTNDYLAHHGIKGQKWGIRRYQNPDGTMTEEGKARFRTGKGGEKRLERQYRRQSKKLSRLEKGTDREYQRKLADKYDAKATIAGGVAGALGYAALVNPNGVNLPLAKGKGTSMRKRAKKIVEGGKPVEIHGQGLLNEALGGHTNAQGVYYQHPGIQAINNGGSANMVNPNQTYLNSSRDRSLLTNSSKMLLGATAVAAGYAAYSGIRSHYANKRTTDAGHKEAVEKYKKQYGKMVNFFADTKYSDLVKKQNSGFNKIQEKERSAIKKADSAYKVYQDAAKKIKQRWNDKLEVSLDDIKRLNKLRDEALTAINEKKRVTGQRVQGG